MYVNNKKFDRRLGLNAGNLESLLLPTELRDLLGLLSIMSCLRHVYPLDQGSPKYGLRAGCWLEKY